MKRSGTENESDEDKQKRNKQAKVLATAIVAIACIQSFLAVLGAVGGAIDSCSSEFIENEEEDRERKKRGRLPRACLHSPEESTWGKVDKNGDDLTFMHFLSLTRASFDELVEACTPELTSRSMRLGKKDPRPCDLNRRIVRPRDIIAMAIKSLLTTAMQKDLHPIFGVVQSTFAECYRLGMEVIVIVLSEHEKSRIYWDRSEESLRRAANRTKRFKAIPNVVAMIDGLKIVTLNNRDYLLQNRDYNGWTKICNRNCVLVWDTFGMIVDVAVNMPGNFHDSKSTEWAGIYQHIVDLPDGFIVVCDSAFNTQDELKGKLCKVKEDDKESDDEDDVEEGGQLRRQAKSEYGKALTHLRQCSEWGNNTLKSVYRRLKMPLPTDNFHRANLLWCCILLTNWRTSTCNKNQVKTYFDSLEDNGTDL